MKTKHYTFHHDQPFPLETGSSLPCIDVQYTTLGQLNKDKSNVVWICHALTGNADFVSWWGGLFNPDGIFDPSQYFIISANMLGSCYGSTGPLSINPETKSLYGHQFPQLTNRDVVKAFDLLRQHLDLPAIHTLIGGSLGGQQVLEWAITKPQVFQHIIPIACNAQHSPWGIAFNEAQRLAIEADPTWKSNAENAGIEGLKAARAIGMISYRHYDTFQNTQREVSAEVVDHFKAASYQRYQGEKLADRFNAYSYWLLSKMMDSHHVGRGRPSIAQALQQIQANTLVLGIENDILFPLSEQKFLANTIPHATLGVIQSSYGHDGFLIEFEQINTLIKNHYNKNSTSINL